MAETKFNFVTDVQPPLQVGAVWPMKSTAMMKIREINIHNVPPICGTIEGGVCQGYIFTWNADGTCNNGDVAFHLKTPAEREAQNQPKKPEPTYDYDPCD